MDATSQSSRLRGIAGHIFRRLPAFRGKARLGRLALGETRQYPSLVHDRAGNLFQLPNLQEPVAFSLWLDGCYEVELLDLFKSVCIAGDTFVDVGANIGVFSIPMSRHVGTAGRVLAVEASESVSEMLQHNLSINGVDNVTLFRCAAADGETKSVEFYNAPTSNFGMGSRAAQFHARPTMVDAAPLDELIGRSGRAKITAMKVDVEGFEAHVFLGARQLLTTASPIVAFEFCDWAEERAFPGRTGWAQEVMQAYGYSLWRLSDYIARGPALTAPIRVGSETIIAMKKPT